MKFTPKMKSEVFIFTVVLFRVSLVAQMVKNLPAVQETWVRSLDWEDPLEKEMATHSSILAWRIPQTEKPGRLQSMGSQRVVHDSVTNTIHCVTLVFNLSIPAICLLW